MFRLELNCLEYSLYCTHLSAFAMDRGVWDPIQGCGLSDPDCTMTCCGKTRANENCKNRISKQSRNDAKHLLALLAQRPADDSLFESLSKIARLLLCKRNHQHKEEEQVRPLAQRWYESARVSGTVVNQQVRNLRMESQHHSSLLYPEPNPPDRTTTPLTPMDIEPAATEPQTIHMEQLRQRSVRFDVSPSSPARIVFGTPNADNTRTPVILRTLQQNDGGRIECLICHGHSADDIAHLRCEQCRRSVHLGCMGEWLERRWAGVSFNCPQCRHATTFDASYSTGETMAEAEDAVASAGNTPTSRGESTSEGALVQGRRRSGRRTRRPEYYAS